MRLQRAIHKQKACWMHAAFACELKLANVLKIVAQHAHIITSLLNNHASATANAVHSFWAEEPSSQGRGNKHHLLSGESLPSFSAPPRSQNHRNRQYRNRRLPNNGTTIYANCVSSGVNVSLKFRHTNQSCRASILCTPEV